MSKLPKHPVVNRHTWQEEENKRIQRKIRLARYEEQRLQNDFLLIRGLTIIATVGVVGFYLWKMFGG